MQRWITAASSCASSCDRRVLIFRHPRLWQRRSLLLGAERSRRIGTEKAMSKFLDPKRCLVIGEIAQSHDGSLGMAHAFIDAVANSGANAIKFQTHIAAAESTPQEPWRVKFSRQDASRYDYWKRMEFTPEQWEGLADHAKEKGG